MSRPLCFAEGPLKRIGNSRFGPWPVQGTEEATGRFPARARLAGGEEGVEEVGGGECYLLVGLLASGAAGGGESAAQGWRRRR